MNLIRFAALTCALMLLAVPPIAADAWGALGYRLVDRVALNALPSTLPPFLTTGQSIEQIVLFASEPDNLDGAGASYDHDVSPADFINLGDDGHIGTLALNPFPGDRETYDGELRRLGTDEYKTGYLPYAIIDGFDKVRKDFAYWRAIDVMARTAKDPNDRTYFSSLRALREQITVRDIGVWSHYVDDGCSPLHASVHSDGWDKYEGSKGIKQRFDVTYVGEAMKEGFIAPRVKAYADCPTCTVEAETVQYLLATNQQVEHVYQLNAFGAFDAPTDAASKFVADRMAAGATQLRDLIALAWAQSDDQSVGTPAISVKDVESGKVEPSRAALGGA